METTPARLIPAAVGDQLTARRAKRLALLIDHAYAPASVTAQLVHAVAFARRRARAYRPTKPPGVSLDDALSYATAHELHALVVARGERIDAEIYGAGWDGATPHPLYSGAKS